MVFVFHVLRHNLNPAAVELFLCILIVSKAKSYKEYTFCEYNFYLV